ncbi:Toxin ParE1 [Mycobacterium sp. THAF192]|nr:Toxin ParE1 [Mycobacterium sp. THAF192]
MNRYLLSPAAQADLEQIWAFSVDRWGRDQAEKYLREIQRGIDRVADNPMIGRVCDEVRSGYRRHPDGSHVLFYRVEGNMIDVVRILHKRMEMDLHLD